MGLPIALLKKAVAQIPEDGSQTGYGICHGSRSLGASDTNSTFGLHQKGDCIGSCSMLPSGMAESRLLNNEIKVLLLPNILSSAFLQDGFIY